MLEQLYSIHERVVKNTPRKIRRYLYPIINWDARAICLFGARGVGKTTLLIQYLLNQYKNADNCLYISADNIIVTSGGLFNLAGEYFKYGGKALIIDEVHKYPNWAQEVKNIIDTYGDKQIIFSGSSAFKLQESKYDLSRRVLYYQLKGLSFREFLMFDRGMDVPVYTMASLLKGHPEISRRLLAETEVLKAFQNYLAFGYYPFFLEGRADAAQRLQNVVEKALFEDIAVVHNIRQPNLNALKKIIWLIATSHPFVPNIERMSRDLSVSKEYIYKYLEFLEMAGLINNVRSDAKGLKLVRKPGKIYLDNTNLIHAITGSIHSAGTTGSIRETFFASQLNMAGSLHLHSTADFLVDRKYIVEVGGPSKGPLQIKGEENVLLAVGDIETGAGKRVPLYLFGLLY